MKLIIFLMNIGGWLLCGCILIGRVRIVVCVFGLVVELLLVILKVIDVGLK